MREKCILRRTAKAVLMGLLLTAAGGAMAQAPTDTIQFADEKAKTFCVARWDANNDGELSYGEAAAVTNSMFAAGVTGGVFGQTEITSFDEFQHFTGVDTVPAEVFSGTSNHLLPLESITLPSSLRYIDPIGQFSNCQLTSLKVHPDNPYYDSRENCNAVIETATNRLHLGCKGTKGANIPQSVNTIGKYALAFNKGFTSFYPPNHVTTIDSCAFYMNKELKNIWVRETMTTIEYKAFYGSGITYFNVLSTVTKVGQAAFAATAAMGDNGGIVKVFGTGLGDELFMQSSLRTVNIGYTVEGLPTKMFFGCDSLKKVTIPKFVRYIGESCFKQCSKLDSVYIGPSVDSIGDYAFYQCSNLKAITLKANTPPTIVNPDNAFQDVNRAIPIYIPRNTTAFYQASSWNTFSNFIETDFEETINFEDPLVGELCLSQYDENYDGELSYAEVALVDRFSGLFTNNYNGVITKFDELQYFTGLKDLKFAFFRCTSLTSVVIPDTPVELDNESFSNTALTSIVIPASVNNIQGNPVRGCGKLGEIRVDTANTIYDSRDSCNAIIETATNILQAGCKNTVIPNTVTRIGEQAFLGCTGLTSIEIPNSVTAINRKAFQGCKGLTSIEIPSSVTKIENGTFYGCTGLDSIVIPNSVSSIETEAFSGCTSLTSIEIPSSVTQISTKVFQGCTGLTSIEIHSSVTSIRDEAFSGCTGLTSIIVKKATPPTVSNINAFDNVDKSIPVYVPSGCAVAYSNAPGWSEFTNFVEFIVFEDENVEAVCLQNYDNNGDGLLTLTEAAAVTSLETIFQGNDSITTFNELRYFTGLLSIENNAFSGCTSLTSIVLPRDVASIGNGAFNGCTSLTSIVLPRAMASIGNGAFDGCSGLTKITVETLAPPTCPSGTFSSVSNTIPVYVYCGIAEDYRVAPGWDYFSNFIETVGTRIDFADSMVERICLDNFDIDGNGEFSECEAAKVTNLGRKFVNKQTITSFDELQYFTGLAGLGWNEQFEQCISLSSIVIPSSVARIEGRNLFGRCDSLSQIKVDPSNEKYDSRDNCNAIIETTTNKLIRGCKNTVIPNSVTSIGNEAFYRIIISQTSIVIPSSVTSIGNDAFYGCTGLTSMTVEATTPPSCGSDVFYNVDATIPVYVPCGSVGAYKNAAGWGTYFTNIQSQGDCTELPITGFTTNDNGWHLIASPLVENVSPTDVINMVDTTKTYDLYKFAGYIKNEWRNYKRQNFNLEPFEGYLYANSDTVSLAFSGPTVETDAFYGLDSIYFDFQDPIGGGGKFHNWHLFGNSYSTPIMISPDNYYRLNPDSRYLEPSSGPVNALEGFFVEENDILIYRITRGERVIESPIVNIDLNNAEGRRLDRARLRMGEGTNMGKLDLMSDPNRLYFRNGGKDYAVVYTKAQGEMPLSFDAAQNGSFTLSVSVEGMEMEYLHLIDNKTGADIDLLATSTGSVANYTFTGKPDDYASRFRLVFSASDNGDASESSETFAYYDGSAWVVNAPANATVQVVDMMGRVIVSGDAKHSVSTNGLPAGMYILRLIDGNDVKTQKIVVE